MYLRLVTLHVPQTFPRPTRRFHCTHTAHHLMSHNWFWRGRRQNTECLHNCFPSSTGVMQTCRRLLSNRRNRGGGENLVENGEVATLKRALRTTESERPAEMFSTLAPSFWACLMREFMKTVQRVPRSSGASPTRRIAGEQRPTPGGKHRPARPASANWVSVRPREWLSVWMKVPQPDEQACRAG